MNCAVVLPSRLAGEVTIPPSKSITHRAIFCALLSKEKCIIKNIILSQDILATIKVAFTLGANCIYRGNSLYIDATNAFDVEDAIFDCGESGSTLRFLIPMVAMAGISACFFGQGRLPQRPIKPYLDVLPKFGVHCKSSGGLPLNIQGKLQPGEFEIPGDVSSQFVTGLLFALPLLDGDSKIILTSKLESKGYVDITLDVMRKFNVEIQEESYGYYIKGNQKYSSGEFTIEGDWSQSAFWLVAGLLSKTPESALIIKGLNEHSVQGDRAIVDVLRAMGGEIDFRNGTLIAYPSILRSCDINISDIPDLLPAISIAAGSAVGITNITGAARLRLKESDRLLAMTAGINGLGGCVDIEYDTMRIKGVPKFLGGMVDSFNDHRIVMALSIASVRSDTFIIIGGCDCVKKSYPAFFNDFKKLGGKCDVVKLR